MTFVPGASGNANGRPIGARNKRTTEIINQIIASGDKDPLATLSELQAKSPDESIRASAASMLAPYLHSKLQSTPAPRYLDNPLALPEFQTIEDAETFLGKIPILVANGQLDFQSGLDLSNLTKAWIDAKYARDQLRLKMANANAEPGEHVIRISGGLPNLPGTNVIMPQLNGYKHPEIMPPSPALGEPSAPINSGAQEPNDSVPAQPEPEAPQP